MNTHQQLINLLNENNIPYKTISHEATPTSEDSAKARGESMKIGAKALLLKSKHGFHLAIMPADQKLNTKKIKKTLKSKSLRFANEEELQTITHLPKGAVPPFGHLFNIQTIIDPLLFNEIHMAFNAASLTDSIKMHTKDYKELIITLPNYEIKSIIKQEE